MPDDLLSGNSVLAYTREAMTPDKGDQVRFHVLSRDSDTGQVRRDSMDDYRAIEPNAIADTFNELTKEQVARRMGGLGK